MRNEVPMLVAFADLTGYARQCEQVGDVEVADVMDGYYGAVAAEITAAGGRTVKFIGDAALVVFEADAVDRGVDALFAIARAADAHFAAAGWPCRLHVKAHFGTVVAGDYGGHFDVLGKNVNAAALIAARGIAISPEAFAELTPPAQQRFGAARRGGGAPPPPAVV
jgi:class 3 adenylate cyclase